MTTNNILLALQKQRTQQMGTNSTAASSMPLSGDLFTKMNLQKPKQKLSPKLSPKLTVVSTPQPTESINAAEEETSPVVSEDVIVKESNVETNNITEENSVTEKSEETVTTEKTREESVSVESSESVVTEEASEAKDKEVTKVKEEEPETPKPRRRRRSKTSVKEKEEEKTDEEKTEVSAVKMKPDTSFKPIENYTDFASRLCHTSLDENWSAKMESTQRDIDALKIKADASPEMVLTYVEALDALSSSVYSELSKAQAIHINLMDKEFGLLTRVKVQNSIGSNDVERKQHAFAAAENYINPEGKKVNLLLAASEATTRLQILKGFVMQIESKKNMLITFLGAAKLTQ